MHMYSSHSCHDSAVKSGLQAMGTTNTEPQVAAILMLRVSCYPRIQSEQYNPKMVTSKYRSCGAAQTQAAHNCTLPNLSRPFAFL